MNGSQCSYGNPYSCTCGSFWTPRQQLGQLCANLGPPTPGCLTDDVHPIPFPHPLSSTTCHDGVHAPYDPYDTQSCHDTQGNTVYSQFAHTPTRWPVQSFHGLSAPPPSFHVSGTESQAPHTQPTA
jgi:hypothetical protein